MPEKLQPGAQVIILRTQVEVNKHEAGGMSKFRGLAYSGEVFDHGWYDKFGVDLSTMRSKARVRMLRNHDFDKEVGEASLINDGTKVTVEDGKLFDHVEDAHVVDGILKQGGAYEFSIGMTGKMKLYDPPEERMLNGRMQTVKWLIYDGRVFETSFVPAGADENTFAEMLSVKLGGNPPEIGDDDMADTKKDEVTAAALAASAARTAELEAQNKSMADQLAQMKKDQRLSVVKAQLAEVGITGEKTIAAMAELAPEAFDAAVVELKAGSKVNDKTKKLLTGHQADNTKDKADAEQVEEEEISGGTEVVGLAGKFERTGLTVLVDRTLEQAKRGVAA